MQEKQLTIINRDGAKLAARLDHPSGEPPSAYALFAHCFTCTKNYRAIRDVSRHLAQKGIAVVRFDFTGLGESEGDFADTSFSSNVEDLVAVADFMRQELAAPQLLIGHSLGGAAVLRAARDIPSSRAVVTIAAPSSPAHIKRHIQGPTDNLPPDEPVTVRIGGRPFQIKRQFLDDLEENRMVDIIRSLERALLVLHSPVDTIVSVENAADIFQAARHPKSFVSLDQADHLLSNGEDSAYVGEVIAAWSSRYVRAA